MTAYTTLLDAVFAVGSAIRGSTGKALRDNISATAEGSDGAPKVRREALIDRPQIVGHVGASSSSGASSVTLNFGSIAGGETVANDVRDGDVVFVFVANYYDTNVGTASMPSVTTSGYTLTGDRGGAGGGSDFKTKLISAYKVMDATPDTSVTVNPQSNANEGYLAIALIVRGLDMSSGLAQYVDAETVITDATIDVTGINDTGDFNTSIIYAYSAYDGGRISGTREYQFMTSLSPSSNVLCVGLLPSHQSYGESGGQTISAGGSNKNHVLQALRVSHII